MQRDPAVAVLDIGKSNAKLALVDLASRATVAMRTTTNVVSRDGPYPHFDVDRLWDWLLEGLSVMAVRGEITTISVATHGACFALVTDDDLALPILDYEYDGPETIRAVYTKARGNFAETLSPDLPNGLNAGRQLYWLNRRFPSEFARVKAILPYPQYWVWRLTGETAAEATSLGCHTDLWNPRVGTYSRLAAGEGWVPLFPPLKKPWDTVGTIRGEVCASTGIAQSCRVVAGIHDSNASLLPHLLARPLPFAVLSSGTWMITFAPGGAIDRLDGKRDCLANVDAFGHAVPSSRFMAGREYELLAGAGVEPSPADIDRVLDRRIMALPTFASGTGPFGDGPGRWSHDPGGLTPGQRAAAASLYCALVTETCLNLAGADGPTIVEGPFSRNALFLAALATLTRRAVIPRPDATGTTDGAALLAFGPTGSPTGGPDSLPSPPLEVDFSGYAAKWRGRAGA